jgi:DNA invertase Pin-like site-specific DNA recombinase
MFVTHRITYGINDKFADHADDRNRCHTIDRINDKGAGVLIGYMRVSKADGSQVFDLQRDALLAVGVEPPRLYEDQASGKMDDRPGLEACLKSLREDDTLVVWKRDRLGRNLRHLVNTIHELMERKIGFRVLTGQGANIDTTTAGGRLVFGIFAALAEFERELIRERTMAGLSSARARGRNGGRPYTMTPAKLRLAQAAMTDRDTKVGDLCKELGVTRQTLYRFVGPKGELRPDGAKLLERKRQQASS